MQTDPFDPPAPRGTPLPPPVGSDSPPPPAAAEQQRKQRISSQRFLLILSLVALLVGGTLWFDQVAPTVTRRAVVTRMHTEKHRKKHGGTTTEHIVDGRDEQGGTFDMTVSGAEYARIDVGDAATVHRSILTGRVVRMEGTGWSAGGATWKQVFFGIIAALGLLGTVLTLRSFVRRTWRTDGPLERRRHVRVIVAIVAVAIAGIVAYILHERSEAHLSSGVPVTETP